LSEDFRDGWPSIALGIIVAGGVYPAVLAGLYASVGAYLYMDRISAPDVIGFALAVFIYSALMMLVGLVWANVATVATLPAVYLVVRSLNLRGSLVWLGAFCGGLAGFLAVLPVILSIRLFRDTTEFWVMVTWLLLGPMLTTVIGQVGGAFGGRRATQRIARRRQAKSNRYLSTDEPESALGEGKPADEPYRVRFGMRHMMWAMAWISVLLTLMRLVGISLEQAVPLLAGWSIFQAATLWLGGKLVRWRRPNVVAA
jgi:hypothetical protein